MGKFKIIDHTADVGIEIVGETPEDIFIQAYKGLYKLYGLKFGPLQQDEKFNFKADTLEELLIKFLNELIYYISVKNKYWNIESLKIEKENKGYRMEVKGKTGSVVSIETEIKAATYHNLVIRKNQKELKTTVIFDV